MEDLLEKEPALWSVLALIRHWRIQTGTQPPDTTCRDPGLCGSTAYSAGHYFIAHFHCQESLPRSKTPQCQPSHKCVVGSTVWSEILLIHINEKERKEREERKEKTENAHFTDGDFPRTCTTRISHCLTSSPRSLQGLQSSSSGTASSVLYWAALHSERAPFSFLPGAHFSEKNQSKELHGITFWPALL